jgi:glutamine synthetase-like protein
VPGYEAPINLVYSQRNRSACCRIPMYSPAEAKEVKSTPGSFDHSARPPSDAAQRGCDGAVRCAGARSIYTAAERSIYSAFNSGY